MEKATTQSQKDLLTCSNCKFWAGRCKNQYIPWHDRLNRMANSEICARSWYGFVKKDEPTK